MKEIVGDKLSQAEQPFAYTFRFDSQEITVIADALIAYPAVYDETASPTVVRYQALIRERLLERAAEGRGAEIEWYPENFSLRFGEITQALGEYSTNLAQSEISNSGLRAQFKQRKLIRVIDAMQEQFALESEINTIHEGIRRENRGSV